jgi:hypothetical protein
LSLRGSHKGGALGYEIMTASQCAKAAATAPLIFEPRRSVGPEKRQRKGIFGLLLQRLGAMFGKTADEHQTQKPHSRRHENPHPIPIVKGSTRARFTFFHPIKTSRNHKILQFGLAGLTAHSFAGLLIA